MTTKNALRTTWRIFDATSSKSAARASKLAFVLAPVFLGIGLFLIIMDYIPTFPALLLSVGVQILVTYLMVSTTTEQEERLVDKFVHDDYVPEFDLLDTDAIKNLALSKDFKPYFYQGAGEWVAVGHVSPLSFIDTLQTLDPYLATISDTILLASVEYTHVVNTYSPRNDKAALRFTSPQTRNAYPVTRLRPPHDLYVRTQDPFPLSAPLVRPPHA